MRFSSVHIVLVVLFAVGGVTPNEASAKTALFRHQISNGKCIPDKYSGSLRRKPSPDGPYFDVETDRLGRIFRVAKMHDARKISELRYEFIGNSNRIAREFDFVDEQLTKSIVYKCDSDNWFVYADHFDPHGDLIRVVLYTHHGSVEEGTYISKTGAKTGRIVEDYGDTSGGPRKVHLYPVGKSYSEEWEFDGDTGRIIAKRYLREPGGGPIAYERNAYEGNGDLLRVDRFDDKTKWYGADMYEHGLIAATIKKSADGSKRQTRRSYDPLGILKQSVQSEAGKVVCTFVYDRKSDGTINRTLAMGPDGELLAEYVGQEIAQVEKNGQPKSGAPGILQKQGDWW